MKKIRIWWLNPVVLYTMLMLLLRVIYTILKTGATYDPQKLLKDIKHPVSEQAAMAA